MIIGDRLRALREERKLSQVDIERRTGLLRAYISSVENGHTVPAVETLEKLARALEVPLYLLFYDGDAPPEAPNLPKRKTSDDIVWGEFGQTGGVAAQIDQESRRSTRGEPKASAGSRTKNRHEPQCRRQAES
jgi:transcriptional regulator with XRE-family HTH domain